MSGGRPLQVIPGPCERVAREGPLAPSAIHAFDPGTAVYGRVGAPELLARFAGDGFRREAPNPHGVAVV